MPDAKRQKKSPEAKVVTPSRDPDHPTKLTHPLNVLTTPLRKKSRVVGRCIPDEVARKAPAELAPVVRQEAHSVSPHPPAPGDLLGHVVTVISRLLKGDATQAPAPTPAPTPGQDPDNLIRILDFGHREYYVELQGNKEIQLSWSMRRIAEDVLRNINRRGNITAYGTINLVILTDRPILDANTVRPPAVSADSTPRLKVIFNPNPEPGFPCDMINITDRVPIRVPCAKHATPITVNVRVEKFPDFPDRFVVTLTNIDALSSSYEKFVAQSDIGPFIVFEGNPTYSITFTPGKDSWVATSQQLFERVLVTDQEA